MAEKPGSGTFWRRLDWRVWRHSYISRTPEAERLAWLSLAKKPDSAPDVTPDVPRAGGERCLAQVRDISLGGIILAVNRKFDSGTLLRIEVQNSLGKVPLTLLARVIQVTTRSEGYWIVSCCFAKELSADELRAFGAERVRPTADNDIRAWVRFPCEIETTFHSVVAAQREVWQAKVLNISAGGVALLVQRKFETGALLSLALTDPDSKQVRKLKVRVVHVLDKKDGSWVLGCTFVKELSDDELVLLE